MNFLNKLHFDKLVEKQTTISKPISFSGIGIHNGKAVNITLLPADSDVGIGFKRIDIENPILNEKLIDEIICDNGGLQMSEIAFEKWLEDYHETQKLPDLEEFSPFQLFYIGQAFPYCDANDNFYHESQVHPLNEFRVIGPLSNSQKFAEIWNCQDKSNMNPEEKCQIW